MKAEFQKRSGKPSIQLDGNVNLALKSRPITATYLENKSEQQKFIQNKEI